MTSGKEAWEHALKYAASRKAQRQVIRRPPICTYYCGQRRCVLEDLNDLAITAFPSASHILLLRELVDKHGWTEDTFHTLCQRAKDAAVLCPRRKELLKTVAVLEQSANEVLLGNNERLADQQRRETKPTPTALDWSSEYLSLIPPPSPTTPNREGSPPGLIQVDFRHLKSLDPDRRREAMIHLMESIDSGEPYNSADLL